MTESDHRGGRLVARPRRGRVVPLVAAWLVLMAPGCSGGTDDNPGTGSRSPTLDHASSATPITAPPLPSPTASPRIPSRPVRELAPLTEAMIRVGGAPDWQVAAFGSLWVTNDPLYVVQRIDAATNRIVARLHVTRFSNLCDGMAAGFGSLWVPDCSTQDLDRVDPATNKVIARIHTGIADFESYIGVGAGSVWIISAPDELVRVDASTDRVAARIHVPPGSVAVTFGFGFAWVTNNESDVVTKVDPSTNEVAGSVDVGPGPRFLTTGEGFVWVLNQDDGTVSKVDPATGDVTSIDAGSPGQGGCIATGFGAVWVTIPEYPLTRIDATTGEVTDHYHGPGGDCLSVGNGSVWLSQLHFGMVWRIPPT